MAYFNDAFGSFLDGGKMKESMTRPQTRFYDCAATLLALRYNDFTNPNLEIKIADGFAMLLTEKFNPTHSDDSPYINPEPDKMFVFLDYIAGFCGSYQQSKPNKIIVEKITNIVSLVKSKKNW